MNAYRVHLQESPGNHVSVTAFGARHAIKLAVSKWTGAHDGETRLIVVTEIDPVKLTRTYVREYLVTVDTRGQVTGLVRSGSGPVRES